MLNTPQQRWHTLHVPQLLHAFQSSEHGLSDFEAKHRLAKHGPNRLKSKRESWLKRIVEPFTSLFVVVLIVAVVMSIVMNEPLDAIIIGVVLVMNALIFYSQQYSAQKVLRDLRTQEKDAVIVLRNGKSREVPSHDLVPGDIVFLFEGNKVPADGRLLDVSNLQVNESMLTGESLPINKQSDPLPDKLEVFDQTNMVFMGTFVQTGSGRFLVCATGNNTQLGAISNLASSGDHGKTPIERKIDDITKTIVRWVGLAGAAVFALALLRGISISEAVRFSLSLVVSVVPEGLPVTLTIVLLFSARKMAAHKALVKKMSAIETMGAVTLIATDKTGTITQNKLQVVDSFDATGHLNLAGAGSVASQNGILLDPLDAILSKHFGNNKINVVSSLPFDQQLRASGAIIKESGGRHMLYIKGAPEIFLSHMRAHQRYKAEQVLESYTKKGYRTIGFGHLVIDKAESTLQNTHIKRAAFDGFIALADPIRKGIAAAIDEAHTAGIKVVMLTGDHVTTAEEIARQAGLVTAKSQVATSQMLNKPPNKKLMATVLDHVRVFGRVLPKHKFNFLRSVKGREVTAMTGDGVNDIPALVEADAGLAMGSGTDAARDASDIVLLDDNFAAIIEAVRLGRAVIANIRKMLFYLISTSIGEAMTMIGALLLGLPLPVTAVQVLWLNLVTDGFAVLPLGLSEPEKHQMKQAPHKPNAPLLSKLLSTRILIAGLVMSVTTLYIFNLLLPHGYEYAQTAAFISLAVAQWANALNANYEKASWFKTIIRPNFMLFGGILISIILQAVVIFGPLKEVFGVVSIVPADMLLATVLPTLSVLLVVDAHKFVTRGRKSIIKG